MPFFSTKRGNANAGPMPTRISASEAEDAAVHSKIGNLREAHAAQQMRTFTRWWNSVLKPRGVKMEDLCAEISTGVHPIELYEELSGSFVRKYAKAPASRFQKLENQNIFLGCLKEKGLRLVNIGAEDLVDSNRTLILGLTWTLILRYEIQKYGASEQELLRWVKACTLGYKGVNITTWGESFNDGLAFCALLNKHDEKCLDFDPLTKDDALRNLDKAFTTAEDRWNVPRLLEPEELAGPSPTDDKSVITYVAKMRQAFLDREADMLRRLKEEDDARARAAREARQAALRSLVDALKSGVDGWNKWTKEKTEDFTQGAKEAPNYSEEKAAAAREGLKEFRKAEKPPKAEEKAHLAELFGQARGEILADAMAAAKEGYTPIISEGDLAQCAPEVLGEKWNAMEKAERDYEDALRDRLGALERARRAKETDDLLGALEGRTVDLLGWIKDKKDTMSDDAKSIGDAADIAKKQAALDQLLSEEKPPKLDEARDIERDLRDVADRRAAEGRPAPPPLGEKLGAGWNGFDDAAANLQKALDDARAKKARESAEAETDRLQKGNDADSSKWLDKVAKKADDFEKAVRDNDVGGTQAETEAKLKDLRDNFQGKTRPEWTGEKNGIEEGRRAVDARRRAEERPPADWTPPKKEIDGGWARLGKGERDYEGALLNKLGALAAEEKERLRRAALQEKALADIADELPPLVQRRKVEREAAATAAEAMRMAADVGKWAAEQQSGLDAKLAALAGDAGAPAEGPLAALEAFADGDKAARRKELLDARAAACEALAIRQLQRAGAGGPAEAASASGLPAAEAAWVAMEESERKLKHALQSKIARAQGANLEWERLQRGVNKVVDWLADSTPQRMRTELGASEAEVGALLGEAKRVAAALGLQSAAVDRLAPLAVRLSADVEFGERATDLFGTVKTVPQLKGPMTERIGRLEAELERQRRLTAERLAFDSATAELEATIGHAQEFVGFAVDTVDTPELLAAQREVGDKLASDLLPHPEAAHAEAVARAEAAVEAWNELSASLPGRTAACEAAHRAALVVAKLQADYAEAADSFSAWHAEVVGLLTLPPAGAAVSAEDVRRAAEIAAEHLPVGEAHARAAGVAARQMATYNIAQNPSVLTLAHMASALEQLRGLLAALLAAAKGAPANAAVPTKKIVAALEELAEACGISPAALEREFGLRKEHVTFLEEEMSARDGAKLPASFDPFPEDRQPLAPLSLPKMPLNLRSHGLAVIEHVNKARKEPTNYADALEGALSGAFEGSTFTCPPSWGGRRLRTAEGEPALKDLLKALRVAPGHLPVLRLVRALDEAAQQLAEELSAGGAKPATTPLTTRLNSRGTFSGAAGEAVVYGVRQPEAIAAQLLLSDGDSQRRNRNFLLNGELKVAGFGLADHPEHGSVCVLVFTSLFATPIGRPMAVECQGEASDDFQRVVDAIPSEQARDIATDALVLGKKVKLDYAPGAIEITVTERDGSQRCSSLKWA